MASQTSEIFQRILPPTLPLFRLFDVLNTFTDISHKIQIQLATSGT